MISLIVDIEHTYRANKRLQSCRFLPLDESQLRLPRHTLLIILRVCEDELAYNVRTRLPCRRMVSSNARTHRSRSSPFRAWKWNVLWSTVMVKVLSSSSSMPKTAPFRRTQPLLTPLIIFSFD